MNLQHSLDRNEEVFVRLRSSLMAWQVPGELVDEVIDRQPGISFERGAMVFCEGAADGLLACVISGFVKVYCPVGDGSRTLVKLAVPGDVVGYQNYLDEKARSARLFEAQAASKCSIALFSRDRIMRNLERLPPKSLVQMIEAMNTYWSQKLQWFASLLTLPFSDRLKLVMSDLALRAGVKDSEGIALLPELGHEDFAEMIGCSRPMVSRLISEMTDSGMIDRRGKAYVLLGTKWDYDCLQLVNHTARSAGPKTAERNAAPQHRIVSRLRAEAAA
jgi:CRP-like cAMP-binding protein